MPKETFTVDKNGKSHRVLPAVRLGNERLSYDTSAVAGSGFIICQEHGTSPLAWVRAQRPIMLVKCCRLCIKEHCQLAMPRASISVENHDHDAY